MTTDNFMVQAAQEVPGLVYEAPVIDVPYWRQQQHEEAKKNPPRQINIKPSSSTSKK
jgi:hypothetical protein